MIKVITLVALLFLTLVLRVQSQSLEWIQESPKEAGMFLRASFIRTDPQDNVYVVKLATTSSPGGTAGFAQILKFNSNGTLLWTASGPSASINPVGWFDVASDGSSFITGTNLFLDISPPVFGFVQKFTPNGTVEWIKLFPNALMGRAVPLPNGDVRVEGSGNPSNPGIPFGNFANIYSSNGTLLSSEPLANVITSTFALDPVVASRSNSRGEFCGVLPFSGPGFTSFQFVKLNSSGDIIWGVPVAGIFFASSVEQVLINENGDCVFVGGSASNLTVGSLSVPPGELRTNFLVLINSAGVPQFIKVYDFQFIDSIACMEPGFSNCWIGAVDLDMRPALARLDSNFNIVDLFVGPSSPLTLSFKIAFNTMGDLAGAFVVGQTVGTWFGSPIVVPPNPNDSLTQSLFIFQLNLQTTNCTIQCPSGLNCCRLANNQQACYRPSQYSCFTQAGMLCPYGTQPCGSACYNLQSFTCSGGMLCPAFHLRCGGACYIPTQYSCFEGGVLCPFGNLVCGTNTCYDPDLLNCCNGVLCPLS